MGRKLVKLSKAAFVNMIASCLEVYKKESYGMLLGTTYNGHSIVSQSINYQSAKRTYDYVNVHPTKENKVVNALNHISLHGLVGDFHSHSDYPDCLSRFDRKDLLEKQNKWVSMLVVIKDTSKKTPWSYNRREKYIAGSIGKRYFVKLHAYKNIEGKIEKVRIECPYIVKLNLNRNY